MTNMEKLAAQLQPKPPDVPGAIGVVASEEPLRVSVRGITFDRGAIQINSLCDTGTEEGVHAGSRVLCATLDGWQTIIVICEVV